MTRKGCYPYDYVSSIDKLKETKLPSKDEFYSKLIDEEIADEDYQHAINVWNTFNCQTLQDYHDLYLKSDVLLLADVFENFRKTCLKYYKLDPCHYYTAPGLAWDACLKETNQRLELLKDYDMLMMFEKGIRGGIAKVLELLEKKIQIKVSYLKLIWIILPHYGIHTMIIHLLQKKRRLTILINSFALSYQKTLCGSLQKF